MNLKGTLVYECSTQQDYAASLKISDWVHHPLMSKTFFVIIKKNHLQKI